jgi:hypothetical protein
MDLAEAVAVGGLRDQAYVVVDELPEEGHQVAPRGPGGLRTEQVERDLARTGQTLAVDDGAGAWRARVVLVLGGEQTLEGRLAAAPPRLVEVVARAVRGSEQAARRVVAGDARRARAVGGRRLHATRAVAERRGLVRLDEAPEGGGEEASLLAELVRRL